MRLLFCLLLLISSTVRAQPDSEKRFPVGQIKTEFGEMLIWLYDQTPRHKESFINLANAGYWDSLTFNRVVRNFVAQGGCPDTEKGFSDSPYLLAPEFVGGITHVYGAVGAGRDNNPDKLSAGCQFYIVQRKEGLPRLDNNYTVFGQVFKGMEWVDAIVAVPTDKKDAPAKPIWLDINVIQMTREELVAQGLTIKIPR
jgi:peptidyl-prolyl cis-trans isomerase B (cyclophilin B)